MITRWALRGYVLEEVLARLLRQSGYRLLVRESQDAEALRDGKHGLLVRGRGANHQAAALGELLIPTPFSLPLRLFTEAKYRTEPTDLTDVRNALGVISDVNEYYASDSKHEFPLHRHHYRYALFSVSGFTADAQKYALAQQISLIDLQGPAFADVRASTEAVTDRLLDLARRSGLTQFPLGQMRTALRLALGTWSIEEPPENTGFDASFTRALHVDNVTIGAEPQRLPSEQLAAIAADLSDQLDDLLFLGFPQSPFILVLQPDDPQAFEAFLQQAPGEVAVHIRYAPNNGLPGEWAIVPTPRRHDLIVRFGVPPLLESWLLAVDEAERQRATLAKEAFFSTIAVFHHGNRLTQLRYTRVVRSESNADEVLSAPVPSLRRELTSPELTFKGRGERDRERPPYHQHQSAFHFADSSFAPWQGDGQTEPTVDHEEPQPWTAEGLNELLRRLEQERPVQARVIRAAARQEGRIPVTLSTASVATDEGGHSEALLAPSTASPGSCSAKGSLPTASFPPC